MLTFLRLWHAAGHRSTVGRCCSAPQDSYCERIWHLAEHCYPNLWIAIWPMLPVDLLWRHASLRDKHSPRQPYGMTCKGSCHLHRTAHLAKLTVKCPRLNQLMLFISPFAFSYDRARKRDVLMMADAAYRQSALFGLGIFFHYLQEEKKGRSTSPCHRREPHYNWVSDVARRW